MLSWFKKKQAKPDEITVEEKDELAPEESTQEIPEDVVEETGFVPDEAPAEEKVEQLADTIEQETVQQQVESPEEETNGTGLFSRLKERLAKTRHSFVSRIDNLFLGKKTIDPELLDDLEEILITADLGVTTTLELLEKVREQVNRNELSDPQVLKQMLKENITSYLTGHARPEKMVMPETGPFLVMVVGVNGVGKTTTIGKVAHKFVKSGLSVLLVAADTFRAAAVEQLKIWGQRNNVDVFSQQAGADPSSVVFDAVEYAGPQNFDVIIVDTAGRLHTKVNLMEELKKIKRVIGKKLENAPHEILLVLDATTGQNSISQAKLFNEAVGVTGLALTKLDGTAKGGIVVNISREFNIPIRFIGIGEQMEDLRDFEPQQFVDALFAENAGTQSLEQ